MEESKLPVALISPYPQVYIVYFSSIRKPVWGSVSPGVYLLEVHCWRFGGLHCHCRVEGVIWGPFLLGCHLEANF